MCRACFRLLPPDVAGHLTYAWRHRVIRQSLWQETLAYAITWRREFVAMGSFRAEMEAESGATDDRQIPECVRVEEPAVAAVPEVRGGYRAAVLADRPDSVSGRDEEDSAPGTEAAAAETGGA